MNANSRPNRQGPHTLVGESSGATLVEYALILALAVTVSTAGVRHFGNVLGNIMQFEIDGQASPGGSAGPDNDGGDTDGDSGSGDD